jgi:RNA polymerase sigma factor (sigma-70 family)
MASGRLGADVQSASIQRFEKVDQPIGFVISEPQVGLEAYTIVDAKNPRHSCAGLHYTSIPLARERLALDAWKILQDNAPSAHAILLRLTLRRDVAEDLLHDLFVKLASRMGRPDDPAAYMARTAINLAMDWRRQNRRALASARSLQPDVTQPPVEMMIENAEDIERILIAAESLTELERQVFVLRLLQQESYDRIGQILNRTAHQVRGICDAAVKHIRRALAERQATHG